MILLIDNYDSFSYNLYQMVGEIDPEIRVIRNDEMTVDEIREMGPDRIILSPGPGRPEDAGIIIEAAKELGREIPILGVCLGHQAVCAGVRGKDHICERADARETVRGTVRQGMPAVPGDPADCPGARYHSLRRTHPRSRRNCWSQPSRRRRGDGSAAQRLPDLRGTVPPGIHMTPDGRQMLKILSSKRRRKP